MSDFFRPPDRDTYELYFNESSKGRYRRTGERRIPEPGEYYISRTGQVHFHTEEPGHIVWGDFEILERIP